MILKSTRLKSSILLGLFNWYQFFVNLVAISILPRSRDYGPYRIGENRRRRRVCAYAQTRQSFRFSHTQRTEGEEDIDKNLGLLSLSIRQHVRLRDAFAHMR